MDLDRIMQAAKRLEQAVNRLEDTARLATEESARRGEVTEDLARVKAQYAALSQVTATVASRLELAINRLDSALEK